MKKKNLSILYTMVDTDNFKVVPFYEKFGYKKYTRSILMRKDI